MNATATSCRSCGAGPDAFDDLGFCSVCGLRERPEPVIASIDAGIAAACAKSQAGYVKVDTAAPFERTVLHTFRIGRLLE